MTSMKGKSKAERETIMNSLEGNLDKKATVLSSVTGDVEKKQQQQDEQYTFGLLLMHQSGKNIWSMEQQLNATHTFMKNSPVLQELFAHHDANKPLAPQLAVMMDAEPANKAFKAAATETKKVAKAVPSKPAEKHVAKAASAAAKAMFLQLANTFMERDCPYCAAQCVDKCHTAGKPYVTCLTECADAGK